MTIPVYNSVDRIIRFAMEDAGLLEDGADPSADQSGRYMQRLNDLVNFWQTQGIKLFLIQDISVPITQGTNLYTFGPAGTQVMTKPLRVEDAYFSDQNGIRRPLLPMARYDWDRMSQVTNQGAVNQYFVDKQLLTLNIYLWNTPDATSALGTFHPVFRTQITTAVTINDSIMFPPEWYMALRWALASEISTGQPDSIVNRAKENSMIYKEALEAWDTEDAPTEFQPDPQGGYGRSRFR
jgi:hypothetical protein